MASHKTSLHTDSRGLTLLEIIIAMAFIALIGSFGLIVGLDSYRSHSFYAERDLFITSLHRARALAMANICTGASCTEGLPHGVHIQPDKFVIFQGNVFNPADPINVEIGRSGAVTSSTTNPDVVFKQLSGDVTFPNNIDLYDQAGHSSSVTIESEGQITWTH